MRCTHSPALQSHSLHKSSHILLKNSPHRVAPPSQRSGRGPQHQDRSCRPLPSSLASQVVATVATLRGGAEGVSALLDSANPAFYFVYLCCAGLGIPLSEDALVVWVGSKAWQGAYGTLQSTLLVLGIVYAGVVISDLMTFSLGVLFRLGFLSRLQGMQGDATTAGRAMATVRRHSKTIGIVQRFSVGFRGPLCLTAGLTGVPPYQFAGGACLGALATMGIQVTAGFFLRNTPNVYLATLALVGLPTLIGATTGPLATIVGLWYAGRGEGKQKQQGGGAAGKEEQGGGGGSKGLEAVQPGLGVGPVLVTTDLPEPLRSR